MATQFAAQTRGDIDPGQCRLRPGVG
jgi:hypothetical protein